MIKNLNKSLPHVTQIHILHIQSREMYPAMKEFEEVPTIMNNFQLLGQFLQN